MKELGTLIPEVKISEAAIVLIGAFPTTVFQPGWYEKNKLLAPEEAEAAKIDVVHPEVTNFHTDWLTISVTSNRFIATCNRDESNQLMRDLVVGTCQLFQHTEITAVGINRNFHFQMPSEEAWHALGHKLTPKDIWKGVLKEPIGMVSLQIQGTRPDEFKGSINVVVQPSVRIRLGAFVQVNDHVDLDGDKWDKTGAAAAKLIESKWKVSFARCRTIAESIFLT